MLFIIGLVSTLASNNIRISIQDSTKDLVKNLYLQMRVAREDAVLFNKQIGLDIDNHNEEWHYAWLSYNEFNETWTRANVSGLTNGTLPKGTQVVLEVNQITLEFQSQEQKIENRDGVVDSPQKELWPDLVFLSSGEISPFRLTVNNIASQASDNLKFILSAELGGKLKMETE